jgi:hypothetical protein
MQELHVLHAGVADCALLLPSPARSQRCGSQLSAAGFNDVKQEMYAPWAKNMHRSGHAT